MNWRTTEATAEQWHVAAARWASLALEEGSRNSSKGGGTNLPTSDRIAWRGR